ncbi:AMP-binding protein [Mycolicibacterium insubricum]|uniref:AMP-binding protein n=2 Tax=Mycolicibacterium insubricum TaxID=444597 RepID=UPI001F208764|nr:AMP-binding protein [Mycolicibacterium insubricum]
MAVLRALLPAELTDAALLDRLAGVLAGADDALLPLAGTDEHSRQTAAALRVGEPIDGRIALVVPTSGSTGSPKGAQLSADALLAAAAATHERLGGPGNWLLALPATHIAGLQVLIRALAAGTTPVRIRTPGFDPAALPGAVAALGPGRRYTSLVSNQLATALEDPGAAAALAELDAVLLGGGPAPAALLERAAAIGINVVRTYGMSETAGGCVYDGVPLAGVGLRLDDGRIHLGGPTLASGYRNPPAVSRGSAELAERSRSGNRRIDSAVSRGSAELAERSRSGNRRIDSAPDPFAEPGWFRTDDLGELDATGRLRVLGRVDDAIATGGLKVLPQVVEAALNEDPAVAEAVVFGVPDERLGQRVVAAITLAAGATAPTLAALRHRVAQRLPVTAAPREVHVVTELPRLGVGKPDRRGLARRFSR